MVLQVPEEMTITTFDPVKGWGWAKSSDFSKVFVHKEDLMDGDYQPLEGDIVKAKVKCFPESDHKKPRALEICLEKEASESSSEEELKNFTAGDTYTGTVKTYDTAKGFGFLSVNGFKDIFVHATGIRVAQRKPGTEVQFVVIKSKKKKEAIEAKCNGAKVVHEVVGQGKTGVKRAFEKPAKPQGMTDEQLGTVMGNALKVLKA
eukprot:gene1172-3024_t